MKTYIVYCHKNTVNNKCYIGWTSATIEKRWKQHCNSSRYGSKTYFHAAIKKYGDSVWEHHILQNCNNYEEACQAEIQWISDMKTCLLNDEEGCGYNQLPGGAGGRPGYKGPKYYSSITRKMMSVRAQNRSSELRYKVGSANRGKKFSQERINKMIIGRLGYKHSEETKEKIKSSNQGQKRALETREKIRLAKIGKPMSEIAKAKAGKHCQRPVLQYSLDGEFIKEFPSVHTAAIEVHVADTNISKACKDARRSSAGFKWEYKGTRQ